MKEDIKQEFEEQVKVPVEVDKEIQEAEDNIKVASILYSKQEFKLNGIGTILFEWPKIGLSNEGDDLVAKFKAKHLRDGELMTNAQLMAVYAKSITVKQDGKEVIVGNGEWTQTDELQLEEIPKVIEDQVETFNSFKNDIQDIDTKLLGMRTSKNKEKLESEKFKKVEQAYELYKKIAQNKLDLLSLQQKKIILFAISVEERANSERMLLYGPRCIFIMRNGEKEPLWKDMNDMKNDERPEALRIISLFNLFLRGGDVRFFVESLGGRVF